MSLISMHGAWLSFSDAPLLDNAELHIEDNERVCLVGRNGAGKSTLMKQFSGCHSRYHNFSLRYFVRFLRKLDVSLNQTGRELSR